MKPEQLASAVSAQTLKPAYLIAGPEFLKVMEAADAIRAAARAAGVDGRDVFDAAAKDFEWQYVENAVGAMGLFSSTRLVEVTVPTGKPGKEGAAMIEAYCANPPRVPRLSSLPTSGATSIPASGVMPLHASEWFPLRGL